MPHVLPQLREDRDTERVVEEMLKLDPESHGVYFVLSNMYAEVGDGRM